MFTKKPATSLIEMIITLSVFSVVATISITLLMSNLQSVKRVQAQAFLYTEAQAAMDQIARSIERNTVDYEAYYLRQVQGETGWESEDYGYYGQSFFDPGSSGPDDDGPYYSSLGVGGYGANCTPGDTSSGSYPEDCSSTTPDFGELDLNTGQHPFDGISSYTTYSDASDMNAFCEADGSNDCTTLLHNVANELILINSAGDERVIYARELFDSSSSTSDYRLSRIELEGADTDSDGLVDDWTCFEKYTCNGGSSDIPYEDDLTTDDTPYQEDFMPITPGSLDVDAFYVYISPVEDPYRAFGEADMQIQPQVTVILTLTLSEEYGTNILGDAPSITLQRTVYTGVYSEIASYE